MKIWKVTIYTLILLCQVNNKYEKVFTLVDSPQSKKLRNPIFQETNILIFFFLMYHTHHSQTKENFHENCWQSTFQSLKFYSHVKISVSSRMAITVKDFFKYFLPLFPYLFLLQEMYSAVIVTSVFTRPSVWYEIGVLWQGKS